MILPYFFVAFTYHNHTLFLVSNEIANKGNNPYICTTNQTLLYEPVLFKMPSYG